MKNYGSSHGQLDRDIHSSWKLGYFYMKMD